MRGSRVRAAAFFPRHPVDLNLGEGFLALLSETLAPCDRLAAAQSIDDIVSQRFRHAVRASIGEDGNPEVEIRQQCHLRVPAGPASAMPNHPVASVAKGLKAEAIVPALELRVRRLRRDVDERRVKLSDELSRQYPLAIQLSLAQM